MKLHDSGMILGVVVEDESDKDAEQKNVPVHTRVGNIAIEIAETVVYVGIAVLLTVTAIGLLGLSASKVGALFSEDTANVALEILDTLLLVFIVVELLFAVRVIVAKRELVAEPFLLAGIIASIKEIIVLSVKAAEQIGQGAVFRDQMWEIGILGVLVLLLGLTAFLLRRKEREPGEGDKGSPYSPDTGEAPER
ncbi:MAG: phosphate-starvation-inducible PsiE family protein [Actinomycetota bacterium]|nr:phosphate-starvation-inducible PsiE family protein [Actinomycetota bacterium]